LWMTLVCLGRSQDSGPQFPHMKNGPEIVACLAECIVRFWLSQHRACPSRDATLFLHALSPWHHTFLFFFSESCLFSLSSRRVG
jgi:hypothetical protein